MKDPEYDKFVDLLKEETRNKFVKVLLEENILDFKSLYTQYLQISETNARHHMKLLLEIEIIQKEKQQGTKAMFLKINPRFVERARKYFNTEQKYIYLGMAGETNPDEQIMNAHNRTIKNNWKIKATYIFTTVETIKKLKGSKGWTTLNKQVINIHLVPVPLLEFEATYNTMKNIIESQIQHTSIIADVTGLTKIHTLALYILAKEFGLTRIYLPKDESNQIILLP